ncbi:hypothetical protein PTQ19_11805 [Microbacterium esteraromaticum]|uniref:hypothetical protein n=1 Tax=Microbacterium esteraromaticum TaxID=57043 RepID=UPI002368DD33|nr:hypothetical protein [Microbacterium esteraromaticum]WDH78196.1 hypothetical protein PTQ19_11805 [Microbacterium esteraromaticum]
MDDQLHEDSSLEGSSDISDNTSAELDEPTTPVQDPQPYPPMTEEDFDRLGLALPKPPYLADIIRSVNTAPRISPERA